MLGAWVAGSLARPARRSVLGRTRRLVQRQRRSEVVCVKKTNKKPLPNIRSRDDDYREQIAYAERRYGRPLQVKKEPVVGEAVAAESYSSLKRDLFRDTLFLGAIGLNVAAACGDQYFTASYLLGFATAVFYVRLLTRGVDRVGPLSPSDSLAGARLAIVALLVVVVGKHKDDWGTQVIPTLLGLSGYKIATIWKLLTAGDTDPMFRTAERDTERPSSEIVNP